VIRLIGFAAAAMTVFVAMMFLLSGAWAWLIVFVIATALVAGACAGRSR
jgi:hypothetical protein